MESDLNGTQTCIQVGPTGLVALELRILCGGRFFVDNTDELEKSPEFIVLHFSSSFHQSVYVVLYEDFYPPLLYISSL